MVENLFRVNTFRKHLYEENIIFMQGCFLNGNADENIIKAYINGEEFKCQEEKEKGYFVRQKYRGCPENITTEISIWIEVPSLKEVSELRIVNCENDEQQELLKLNTEELLKIENRTNYCIDGAQKINGTYVISGWAIYRDSLNIYAENKNGEEIKGEVELIERVDVCNAYPELKNREKKYGFRYIIPRTNDKEVCIVLDIDDKKEKDLIYIKSDTVKKNNYYSRAVNYAKKNGIKRAARHFAHKVKVKIKNGARYNANTYKEWIEKYDVKPAELKEQAQRKFDKNVKFSIIVPLYNTPKNYLLELIDSAKKQTYKNWELCFADGSSNDDLTDLFDELCKNEKRIKYKKLTENMGISGNTNEALKLAEGDYIALADHDDLLAYNALYEFADIIEKHDDADVIYSDEDKIDMEGKERFEPHFKPDFNIDLLCSTNYICHMFVTKREIAMSHGMFRSEFDGSQDYDFIFRCIENAEHVYHIPKILYHWRCHPASTAGNPESKLYAFEAGKRAIQAYYNRKGIKAEVKDGASYGFYHSVISVRDNPLVSILIPNKDHIDDLKKCITSIYDKTLYRNFEIIIIENNSEEKETFAYYETVKAKYENLKVVIWNDEFNYSLINNFGAQSANGEYLLLLNNDTEVINETWLEEMLGYCQREDVGIVGARLYYNDDTVQHAGVIVGHGGIAGHIYNGQPREVYGYFARAMCTQDYSAVTAACLMTKKSIFDAVGGLTAELKVAFNDIDYCLKVREIGKLVVYNPWAELYHYESKSRGLEDTPEKQARFNREIDVFQKRWFDILENGDPYYNPNLSLETSDFGLRK